VLLVDVDRFELYWRVQGGVYEVGSLEHARAFTPAQ
jgi:hypothetical protein